jgi:hexaprenyl-diphosphate synthase
MESHTTEIKPQAIDITNNNFAQFSRHNSSLASDMAGAYDRAKRIITKLNKAAFHLDEQPALKKYADKAHENPLNVVEGDLKQMNKNIRELITTKHGILESIANYYFSLGGKKIRPVITMLMSRATSFNALAKKNVKNAKESVLPKQLQLAEIVEMIHTASIIHDDVIDEAHTRRGVSSVNVAFGNKMAILAGDFLLARASISLAQLGNHEVTEQMSRVISDLVEGEFMQATPEHALDFNYYMEKTYLKTASLIANSCRCAALIGGYDKDIVERATLYGRHLGLAFQLIDDMLDYVGTEEALGKPVANDLKLGLATAPALYAVEQYPELKTMVQRQFSQEGDVARAQELVQNSEGLSRTKQLAMHHCKLALDAISVFSDSPAKQALMDLTEVVISRQK